MRPEDFLTDDAFLAWYYKADNRRVTEWEARMEKDPLLKQQVQEAVKLIKALEESGTHISDMQVEQARERLRERIGQWERSSGGRRRPFFVSGRFRLAVAASIALFVVSVFFWLKSGENLTVYRTGNGESRMIVLSDGSVVNLNTNSELKVSAFDRKGGAREVWLDGEAYFEVKKDGTGRKFIVRSDELNVEVLGTQFNVRKQKERIEVVLESGKVRLSSPETKESGKDVLMQPGELVEFSKASRKFTKREVNTQLYTSWKEGRVVFENASLNEIVDVLTNRYGLRVTVEKGSELGEFNGVFPSDNPEILLKALEKTYTTQIVRKEEGVWIRK